MSASSASRPTSGSELPDIAPSVGHVTRSGVDVAMQIQGNP